MRISKQYQALKDYIAEKESPLSQFYEIELHRCHFRIDASDKQYIFKTAAKLKWSANHLCSVMIEKCLPLIETALFKGDGELDCDVIMGVEPDPDRMPIYREHKYTAGKFNQNMFVVLTRETFLILQYLKEQLHFYSYSELFRLIVSYFYYNLDLENLDEEKGEDEVAEEMKERVRGVVGKIKERLEVFRSTQILIGTIVPINIRRIRATKDCLYPPTQIFLEKMVV